MIKFLITFLLVLLLFGNSFAQYKFYDEKKDTLTDKKEINNIGKAQTNSFEKQISNLKTDLFDNEAIISWTFKNTPEINTFIVEKVIDKERTMVAAIETKKQKGFSSDYIQEDLLSDEDLEQEIIIYSIRGIDTAGQTVLHRQIPVYPLKENDFELFQNYPNPFNPDTKISFYIPTRQNVTLRVFNILGNQIDVLVDETKPAGTHEVEFNGSQHTSGVYIYTLQIGEFTETKRMILMK